GAAEAGERFREEAVREAGAVVGDVELDDVCGLACVQVDAAVSVADRVLEQVAQRLLEPQPVALEAGLDRCHGERAASVDDATLEPRRDRVEQRAYLDRLVVQRESSFVEPREQEQVFRELAE